MPKVTRENPERSLAPAEADYFEVAPDINVFSWSPSPPGTKNAKCTQVHLIIGTGTPRMLIRFKGPDTLNALILALEEHSEDVFGVKRGGGR